MHSGYPDCDISLTLRFACLDAAVELPGFLCSILSIASMIFYSFCETRALHLLLKAYTKNKNIAVISLGIHVIIKYKI